MADDLGDPAAQAAALAQQQQAAQLQAQQQAAQLQAQATAAAQAQAQALAAAQEVVKAAAAAGVNIDATGLVTDLNKQTQEKSTAPLVLLVSKVHADLAKNMAMIKRCLCRSEEDIKGLLRTKSIQFFSYKQIKRATNNFERTNKLGRGGFGTVYKGIFVDGTAFAAKVLSSESKQGIEEFLTEIESLTEAKHANLVRLLGCCVQKQNRVLVYEYAENNSLDHALKALGSPSGAANLPWSVRSDICIGTARGLSFLHEEHEPSIVHRDIKASNVLLDRNFVPKIADFGLAKLFPDNITHISTRVVGTTGYLAPEYFVHGQLTKKADVYSFGVLVLEIISGQRVPQTIGPSDTFLVRQAWLLYQEDRLLEMVDASIKDDCPEAEVLRYAKVGLACTQAAPAGRPTMSQVVKMLSWPDTFWKLETRPTDHLGCAEAEPVCPGVSLSAGSLRARWPTAAIPTTSSANSGSVTCSEIVPR